MGLLGSLIKNAVGTGISNGINKDLDVMCIALGKSKDLNQV